VLATGAGSHMAAVTPDGSAVWVAAIGARQLVEIPLDLAVAEPEFAIAGDSTSRSCSRTRIRLAVVRAGVPRLRRTRPRLGDAGPGHRAGRVVRARPRRREVVHAYDPTVIRANCGIGFTADGDRAIANWSGTFGPEVTDREGEWYVFDVDSFEVVQTASSDGVDAHGLRLTPDGAAFLQVNRGSDDGQVIDATTLEVLGRSTPATHPTSSTTRPTDGSRT
jgi:DNA-binding beta-propeller fold protein YncE